MYIHTETFLSDVTLPEKTLLLNIETTGLSSRNAFIYMIGLGWRQNDTMKLQCLLAESRMDERKLLDTLHDLLADYRRLLTYGGHSFTYRFLNERWYNYHDENDSLWHNIKTDDLQKDLSRYKACLPLTDLKKTTAEDFVHFKRQTGKTGKELIDIYMQWERSHTDDLRDLLLAHHSDDMRSLLHLQKLLAYMAFWNGDFKDTPSWRLENDRCIFSIQLKDEIVHPVQYRTEYALVTLDADTATVTAPVYFGRLRHFLPGPVKDYYYLPVEDQAVHRSVACYVDPAYRKKATAATCYITREGLFLPTGLKDLPSLFQEGYHSKPYYIEYAPETWQKNPRILHDYLVSVINRKTEKPAQ